MDHVGILKKAFNTTRKYRALWILGFLWALVGGNGGHGFNFNSFRGGNIGSTSDFNVNPGDVDIGPGDFNAVLSEIQAFVMGHLGIIISISCFLILLLIAMAVVRYVLQAGIYRVLYRLETEGVEPTVKAGFREGWHRRTWRLFLQNLLLTVVMLVVIFALIALVALPGVLLLFDNDALQVLGGIGIAVTGIIAFIFFIIFAIVVGILATLWWRAAVLDDMGAIDAMGYAWRLARANIKDLAIIWLLMVGAAIVYGILLVIFILIVMVVVAIIAGLPAYLLYQATDSLAPALLWGIPVGFILFVLPVAFVSGLYLIFQADVWNTTYLQLSRAQTLLPESATEE